MKIKVKKALSPITLLILFMVFHFLLFCINNFCKNNVIQQKLHQSQLLPKMHANQQTHTKVNIATRTLGFHYIPFDWADSFLFWNSLFLYISLSLSPSSSPYLSFFDFLFRYYCTGILYGINVRCKPGAGVYFIHFKALDSMPCNGTSNAVYSVVFHLSLRTFMWKDV